MAETIIRQSIFHDAAHFGVRITIGMIFIMHSLGKFGPGFAENLPNMGLPSEMQIPIALAEFVPGVLLINRGIDQNLCIIAVSCDAWCNLYGKGSTEPYGQGRSRA